MIKLSLSGRSWGCLVSIAAFITGAYVDDQMKHFSYVPPRSRAAESATANDGSVVSSSRYTIMLSRAVDGCISRDVHGNELGQEFDSFSAILGGKEIEVKAVARFVLADRSIPDIEGQYGTKVGRLTQVSLGENEPDAFEGVDAASGDPAIYVRGNRYVVEFIVPTASSAEFKNAIVMVRVN